MRKTSIHLPLLLILSFGLTQGNAQPFPWITQIQDLQSIVNPASVSHDYFISKRAYRFSGGLSYRNQWYGLNLDDGNKPPWTAIMRMEKIPEGFTEGSKAWLWGGNFTFDQYGPIRFSNFYGRMAINLLGGKGRDEVLTLGLSLGLEYFGIQPDANGFLDQRDPLIGERTGQWYPNGGIGLYYYKSCGQNNPGNPYKFRDQLLDLYAGISWPHIQQINLKTVSINHGLDYTFRKDFYLLLGAKFNSPLTGSNVAIEPFVWFKYLEATGVHVNFNVRMRFSSLFFAGLGYSTQETLHTEIGFVANRNKTNNNLFRIGFGYDLWLGKYRDILGDNFEINLTYLLNN